MQTTDLTVGAVVEHQGRFLLVEEYASGRRVFSQPGGHIEPGESPEQAVVRETREETGCDIACKDLVGVYLWIHPQTRRQYLRITFAAQFLHCDKRRILDDGIVARHWLTLEEIGRRQSRLRSPAVLRCVNDFVSGNRQSDALLTGMLPLQHNVDRVIATAALV